MSEFKVGDRVYCPQRSKKIHLLGERVGAFPICIVGIDSFTQSGFSSPQDHLPSIFHATQENYELLSKLYPNVEFEKPKLTGSDLTRQMLADGAKNVLCWVSDTSDDHAFQVKDISVVTHLRDGSFFVDKDKNNWNYAVPIPRNYYAMDDSDE